MKITNYLPLILRYALVWMAAALATRGWTSSDQTAVLTQNLDVIVGALVSLGTVAYALVKRPSEKALDAAKAIDKQLPAKADVVIVTPGDSPNIVVSAKNS
ncbi:hypothetical protein [Pararhizobium antarcticum]|uniref:Holin n=1 Tax=Pararhizobium antarcticum TaxID=1798805 RepID=A0A657LTP8_9HYPH|nr:hypothetical protein [Pararhizobium antarcticum]OJF97559.1 hypothetical protein AX760_16480 [Pararhizobium antarcticum]